MALRDYLTDGRRRLAVARRRTALRLRPGAGPRDADAATAALRPAATVCVLCYGNVCRSPFAERYLAQRLADHDDATVVSAGFHKVVGRRSPETAVRAASEFGVDLTDHRSRRVTEAMLARSDVVLAMDALNLHHLDREFGTDGQPVFLLGDLADDGGSPPAGFEISDPYGGDLETFTAVYERVVAGVDGLVSRLADGP